MRRVAILFLVACGGSNGTGSHDGAVGTPGLLADSGWTELLAYEGTGVLGIDSRQDVFAEGLVVTGGELKLAYATSTQSQQDPIVAHFGLRVPVGGGNATAFEAGFGFPPWPYDLLRGPSTNQFLWDGGTPVWFRGARVSSAFWRVAFTKATVTYIPPSNDVDTGTVGTGHVDAGVIGPDGTHWLLRGSIPYSWNALTNTWTLRFCAPRLQDPRLSTDTNLLRATMAVDDPLLPVVAGVYVGSDPTANLWVWTTDPAAPHDGADNPTCGPLGAVVVPSDSVPHLRVVGGATKVIITSATKVAIFAWNGATLVQESEAAINSASATAASVATDGSSLWVGFADAANEGRPSVLLQTGATLVPVGKLGFGVDEGAPLLAAANGIVYAVIRRAPGYGASGYGALWIVAPASSP